MRNRSTWKGSLSPTKRSADALLTSFCRLLLALFAGLALGCSEAPNRNPSSDATRATAEPAALAQSDALAAATYVGSDACAGCHQGQYQAWRKSHHHAAMQVAEEEAVLGQFDDAALEVAGVRSAFSGSAAAPVITTDGPDGALSSYEVRYTFGVMPLQQYLLAFPDGRLQATAVAWDARSKEQGGQRWFHLQPDAAGKPDDVLHWTKGAYQWNFMCADCHSTAVQKNYDPSTRQYQTEFAELTVGCEACHGPGSEHMDNSLHVLGLATQEQQLNACAPCHSRRSQLAEGFTPNEPYLNHYLPALLDEGLYHADGQILDEVYVYGSFLQSKMQQQGVRCSDCHDAHSGEQKLQGNALCTQCHNSSGRTDFPTLPLADFDDPSHHFHEANTAGAQCVNCHMPTQTYMVIDDRRDHSFRVPRPDLSAITGAPNACGACHSERSADWASKAIAEHHPTAARPHYGTLLTRARAAEPAAEPELATLASDTSQPGIVRATALSLMSAYDRGWSSDAISNGLRDADALVRIGALRGASRWLPPKRWQKVSPLLRDELLAVRVEAARTLTDTYSTLAPADQATLRSGLQEYLQTLMLNADRAESQSSMASVHLALGEIPVAEDALHTALSLNSQWVPAMVNLADLYRATGRDTQAGALLDRALAAAPEAADVLLAKGLWLVRQQRAEDALPLLRSATELAPQVQRYAYIYAVALNSLGQSEAALAILDNLLEKSGNDRQLLEAAASIARDAGLTDRFEAYVRRMR